MNTITPNNSNPARGIHRGLWIGGGLMALTIVALATTLIVKSNGSDSAAAAPVVAATDATTSTTPTDSSAAIPAPVPVTTAQTNVAPVPIPVHNPHHTPSQRDHGWDNSPAAPGGPSYANDPNAPQQVASVPTCPTCGVIDSYSTVQVQGQSNGVGAVAGGVGGALIGSKVAGRGNHTLGGIIGAVGGGLLGNAVEKHERTTTVYEVHVRMADGSLRTVRQSTVPAVGARVRVEGNTLHVEQTQG